VNERPLSKDPEAGVTVRPLTYSDLPQVIAIERRSFSAPWSLAMFVLELSKPSGVCLAAVQDSGKLTAYLVCSRYDDVWHLMNLAVDPAARRHGVATMLLERMLEQAGQHEQYTLEVRMSNSPAIALYERFAFKPAGTRRRYYQDTGEDALIMWRTTETASSAGATSGDLQ